MKALGVAKRCWLLLLVGGFLSTGYYLLSTSDYVKVGQKKLQQITAYLFSRSPPNCRFSANRSEDEVVRCLEHLAQEVLKNRTRPHHGRPGRTKARRRRLDRLEHLRSKKVKKGIRNRHGRPIDDDTEFPFVTPPMEELLDSNAFRLQAREDPFKTTDANQDGFVRSRDIKTSRKNSEELYEPHFPQHPVQLYHSSRQTKKPPRQNEQQPFVDSSPQHNARQKFLKNRLVTQRTFNVSASALQDIGDRFKQRRAFLEKACGRYGNSSLFKPLTRIPFVLPNPSHNSAPGAVYCLIPKTGSTTWLKVLNAVGRERMRNHRKTKGARRLLLKDFNIRKESLDKVTQNLTVQEKLVNFVFVREPYSRLLSAYVDKLFSPNSFFWTRIGKYIVQTFRKNPSKKSLTCGHDVTFAEFVQYVLHTQETGHQREDHFVPVHDHCHFCNISYDYIGHLETLNEDMPYVLHVLQSQLNYSGPFEEDTLSNNARWIFSRWRDDILQCMTMEAAGRRLWKKWQIRGIISKAEPFPFTGKEAARLSKDDVAAAGLAAVKRSGGLSEGKNQKTEALREAYSSVSLSDRLRLRRMFFLDFELFGFDSDLPAVFSNNESASKSDFNYFDV